MDPRTVPSDPGAVVQLAHLSAAAPLLVGCFVAEVQAAGMLRGRLRVGSSLTR